MTRENYEALAKVQPLESGAHEDNEHFETPPDHPQPTNRMEMEGESKKNRRK
jgi:hypothetical protein